nr:helix-turn-helix transcriptional regulator [Bradyrhizobium sp. UFLA03-84]
MYPLLSAMEQWGYLKSRKQREDRTAREFYRATPLGKKGLALARLRVKEFTGEAIGG